MFMSEEDLPKRLTKYDGDHVIVQRIALTQSQVRGLPSFPVADKQGPTRQMVRRQLRQALLGAGRDGPERSARLRRTGNPSVNRASRVGALRVVNAAEQELLRTILANWKG